jgi:outer membrane protein OmpA-like peptidoglycan-associated protein
VSLPTSPLLPFFRAALCRYSGRHADDVIVFSNAANLCHARSPAQPRRLSRQQAAKNRCRGSRPLVSHRLRYLRPTASQHHVPSYSDGSHYVARQPQTAPGPSSYSATPITQNQQQPAQWAQSYNPTPQSYVANYQDPRSIQQPYYYGQTDPSVYNSPWPPTQQDAQTNVHTPSMVVTTQPHPMPYVQPSHSPVDSQHPYESGPSPSYPSTLQAFDVGNYGLSHDVQSQQQRQVRKSPSNLYFEDASMHLKMQSLPILDSLVSSTHPFVRYMYWRCIKIAWYASRHL